MQRLLNSGRPRGSAGVGEGIAPKYRLNCRTKGLAAGFPASGEAREQGRFFFFFNCILGFGVHVQNMQDSCIGTHVAVWFAVFLPFTHIWHFSPCYPSLAAPPRCPSPIPPNRLQCVVLPSLCPCVLIVHHPPMSENMQYFIFCSCVSLLRMMVSRFIHVPTKDTNSSFLVAA